MSDTSFICRNSICLIEWEITVCIQWCDGVWERQRKNECVCLTAFEKQSHLSCRIRKYKVAPSFYTHTQVCLIISCDGRVLKSSRSQLQYGHFYVQPLIFVVPLVFLSGYKCGNTGERWLLAESAVVRKEQPQLFEVQLTTARTLMSHWNRCKGLGLDWFPYNRVKEGEKKSQTEAWDESCGLRHHVQVIALHSCSNRQRYLQNKVGCT